MLFVLTGDTQAGKTRWLEALVSELERSGAGVFGVVAPGVWEQGPREGEFRKLAIDNVLLPGRRRIRMADWIDPSDTNRDDQGSQLQLEWRFHDEAIDVVNRHFECSRTEGATCNVLVVDELGRLELEIGKGLTEAMQLLDEGPSERMPHALVVVRDWLANRVVSRYEDTWRKVRVIGPCAESRKAVLSACVPDSVSDVR